MTATHRLLPLLLALGFGQAQAGILNELYGQARVNDPQLKAAEATADADLEALPQARARLLPILSLGADLSRQYSDTSSEFEGITNGTGFGGVTGDSDGTSYGYSVALTQPVYSAENWYRFQRGKVLSEQALVRLSQAQQALVLRTVEAYLAVLDARTALQSVQAEEKAVQRRLDQVKLQFEVGLIAITDVQEAQAALDSVQVERILAEGTLANSFEALERLTGHPPPDLPPLARDYPIQPLTPDSAAPWIRKAEAENLELTLAQLDTDVAHQSARIGRAGHQPTLDLTASYGHDDTPVFEGNSGQIALQFNLPLYTGGQISSAERETRARWRAAQQLEEDTRRRVVEQTRSLYRDLTTDIRTVAARRQLVRSAEVALKATATGFEVGTRNVVDVLEAERALFAAQRQLTSARHQYVRDLFRFKQAVGTLAPEDIQALDRWMRAEADS